MESIVYWLPGFYCRFLLDACRLPRRHLVRGLDSIVELLGKIDDPAAQADMLRGVTDALKGRRQVPMPQNWRPLYANLQKSANPDVRALSVGLALVFGDADAVAELHHRAADAKIQSAERLRAIDALANAHDAQLGTILLSLLDDPAIAGAAIRDLAAYSEPATPGVILDRYPRLTEPERHDALSTLCSRGAWGAALLDGVEAGKIPRADISALTIRAGAL